MKIAAIISEFDPFHAGHAYLVGRARALGADYVLSIMSGSFTQRGEPALYDKFTRARLALEGGIDAVIELPQLFAVSSAEGFAEGAVAVLNALGCVDEIIFGSENTNIDELTAAARYLAEEPKEYSDRLRSELARGASYPAARGAALIEMLPDANLFEPNVLLGVEYIKALIRSDSKIKPVAEKRLGNHLETELPTVDLPHDARMQGMMERSGRADKDATHAQGAALRAQAAALRGEAAAVHAQAAAFHAQTKLPRTRTTAVLDINEFPSARSIREATKRGELTPIAPTVFPSNMLQTLLCRLRSMDISEIATLGEVTEGLEARIKRAAVSATTYSELVAAIKTKRYAESRIRRILIYALLGITKDDLATAKRIANAKSMSRTQDLPMAALNVNTAKERGIEVYAIAQKGMLSAEAAPKTDAQSDSIACVRVLGIRESSRVLLSVFAHNSCVPIAMQLTDYKTDPLSQFDILATDLRAALEMPPASAEADFRTPPVVV